MGTKLGGFMHIPLWRDHIYMASQLLRMGKLCHYCPCVGKHHRVSSLPFFPKLWHTHKGIQSLWMACARVKIFSWLELFPTNLYLNFFIPKQLLYCKALKWRGWRKQLPNMWTTEKVHEIVQFANWADESLCRTVANKHAGGWHPVTGLPKFWIYSIPTSRLAGEESEWLAGWCWVPH